MQGLTNPRILAVLCNSFFLSFAGQRMPVSVCVAVQHQQAVRRETSVRRRQKAEAGFYPQQAIGVSPQEMPWYDFAWQTALRRSARRSALVLHVSVRLGGWHCGTGRWIHRRGLGGADQHLCSGGEPAGEYDFILNSSTPRSYDWASPAGR